MFCGEIYYNHSSGKTLKYDVSGVDNSSTCSLLLSSVDYDAILAMESDDLSDSDTALWERRCDIGIGDIKVETGSRVVYGRVRKNPVNSFFFCRLGALIRYAKINCSKSKGRGYSSLRLASGEFELQSRCDYEVFYPMDSSRLLARVTLDYGDIVSIFIQTDTFTVDLRSSDRGILLFRPIKDGWRSGIAYDRDYLGFDVKKQELIQVSSNMGMYTCIQDVIKAHPNKELGWLLEKDYKIVDDTNLDAVCDYIYNWDGYVYFDTETTGLNINFKSRLNQADVCVGIVLSVKDGESFYFPMQMRSIPNLCGGDHIYFMERYMKPILEKKELVAHNAPFDWKVAYIYDIVANIVHDTLAIIRLTLGAERKNYPGGLKENAKLMLNHDSLELSDLVVDNSWGESDVKFWDLPYELVKYYACADTDNTRGIREYADRVDLLGRYNARKVYEIEVAFSLAVAYQEFYGHRINIENLDKLREDIVSGQNKCMAEMVKIVGHTFNPNSSPELIKIMYGELGIPEQISRKTGRPTTEKEVMRKLADLTDEDDNLMYPFCAWLMKYREYEGVRKVVNKQFPENMTEDGYIFSEVMQYGTTTGRVSIRDTNYQSYNDPVKKNVIPRPGFYGFDTDYSSVEYRVLVNMVRNERIKEQFKNPDFDYHTYQASHMYSVPYASVTKKLRKAAKGINFGLPYGMGDESLGVRIFGEASKENTRKAAKLRSLYFKGQEDIRDWFERHRNKGAENGFTETYFGRRRYYHREDYTISAIKRQAGNMVIQGTAADIYKLAVGRVFKRICKEGWLGKVLLTGFIHDELFGEVSKEINPGKFLKVLREEFEVVIRDADGTVWCPLYMGFGFGRSWYEAKSVELPIKLQWELVDKYGESGFPDWDGDMDKFCDSIQDRIRTFEIEDIRSQILEKGSQGKEISATLNAQLLDLCGKDAKLYTAGVRSYCEINSGVSVDLSNLRDYLSKTYKLNYIYTDSDGNLLKSLVSPETTQGCIDMFCLLHSVDRILVDLKDVSNLDSSLAGDGGDVTIMDGYDDDDTSAQVRAIIERLRDYKIDTLGVHLDLENKRIYLKELPRSYMNFIFGMMNKDGRGYRILCKTLLGKTWELPYWLDSKMVNVVQDMYFKYFRQHSMGNDKVKGTQ